MASAATAATSASGSIVVFQPMWRNTTFVQLLDRNGEPLTPHGIAIARSAYDVAAASDGRGYLVVWSGAVPPSTSNTAVWACTVSATGEVSAPRVIGNAPYSATGTRVASNGHGYLVTWIAKDDQYEQVRGRGVDAAGTPLGTELALSDSRIAYPPAFQRRFDDDAVASDGNNYLVGFCDYAQGGLSLRTVATFVPVAGGVPGTAKSTIVPVKQMSKSFMGPNYLLAWYDGFSNYIATVRADGTVGPPHLIGNGEIQSMAANASGAAAIVNQRSGSTPDELGVFAVRFTAGALAVDRRKMSDSIGLATNYVVGTTAAGDFFAVRLAFERMDFAILTPGRINPALPLVFRPLAQFAKLQRSPAVIQQGDTEVLAWVESSAVRVTRVRNGVPLETPPLSVAANTDEVVLASDGERTLILWQEPTRMQLGPEFLRHDPNRIVGCFLSGNGTLSPPFTFDAIENTSTQRFYLSRAVWSGTGFVLLWRAEGTGLRIWRSRIDRDGHVTAPPPAPLDLAMTASGHLTDLHIDGCVPTRDGFLLLYDEWINVTAGKNIREDLFVASFADDASPIGPRRGLATSIDAERGWDIGSDGRGHLLALFSVTPAAGGPASLLALPLDERGNPTGAAAPAGDSTYLRLSWTGTSFLALNERNQAALIDVDGRVIAPMAPLELPGAQGSAASGDAIAYVRAVVDPELGDVDRVFVRRLIPPRRRAARP